MAHITLSQLNTTGSELFQDSQGFLNELYNVDVMIQGQYTIVGGMITLSSLSGAFVGTYSIGSATYVAKSYSKSYYP